MLVGGEGYQVEVCFDVFQGVYQVVVVGGGGVEVVQCFGYQQVGIGVEVGGEFFVLVVQVIFDLEFDVVQVVVEFFGFQYMVEFGVYGVVGQVGDMVDYLCQFEVVFGNYVLFLEVVVEEFRVGKNCLLGDFVEGDVLC